MEVSSLNPRGVYVSSGDGAQPHGRDLSSEYTEQESTNRTEDIKRENPRNLAAETLAGQLLRQLPGMDAQTAQRVAKAMLSPAVMWEPQPESDKSNGTVDVSA